MDMDYLGKGQADTRLGCTDFHTRRCHVYCTRDPVLVSPHTRSLSGNNGRKRWSIDSWNSVARKPDAAERDTVARTTKMNSVHLLEECEHAVE